MNQELIDTINELVETKFQLHKLTTDKKIYKKLSDIEITLSKIECHENEQLKLMRFMAKILYHQTHQFTKNYNKKVTDKWWQDFCKIAD